jgi:arylsulfatase
MSDNGTEGHDLTRVWPDLAEWVDECCDNSYANMGQADSYIWYGQNWAQAGVVPYRMYKGYTSQGGVNVPAFASFPQWVARARRSPALTHVTDVMPTILELAGVAHPGAGHYQDREIVAMHGKSMLSFLRGKAETVHDEDYFIGWELFGKRAVRQGDWKVIYEPYHEMQDTPVAIWAGEWQLYNLNDDPAELNDLSADYPDKLHEMIALWEFYAEKNNVILPDAWDIY